MSSEKFLWYTLPYNYVLGILIALYAINILKVPDQQEGFFNKKETHLFKVQPFNFWSCIVWKPLCKPKSLFLLIKKTKRVLNPKLGIGVGWRGGGGAGGKQDLDLPSRKGERILRGLCRAGGGQITIWRWRSALRGGIQEATAAQSLPWLVSWDMQRHQENQINRNPVC